MTTPLPDDELTELVDFLPSRVDLVGKAANGTRFLIAKQAAEAGLLDPEFVRTLIGKQADPEPPAPEQVTMTGSPAAIAAFIHKAAERADEYEQVCKEKYNAADRKRMASSGAAMSNESYPIADEEDLDRAIRAVGRGGSSHDAIRRHIISRARSLGASSKIPDNWNSDGSLKESVSKEDAVTGAVAKADMGPELDGGVDGLDPTVPLAEPDEMGPGDMTDPGSPAWESIDAATARKWTSIAVRLKNALCVLAEREMLEAASADPSDAENAFDLEDAQCALDYVIDTLAGFAVDEQAEADLGGEAMETVGKSAAPPPADLAAIAKAMGTDGLPGALMTVETFGAVIAKSGRVLSSVNETHIREAASRLNTVLSSLPQAPTTDDGQPVAKMTPAEEAGMPEATPSETVTAESGQAPAMGAKETEPVAKAEDAPAALALVYDRDRTLVGVTDAAAIMTRVAKADGDGEKKPMQAVFDQDGDLIGIVDPDAIQPVTGAGGKPAPEDAAPASDDGDGDGGMTPQPPADAGTPAGAVDDDGTVAKSSTEDVYAALESAVPKAVAAALDGRTPAEDVAKQADVAGLLEEVKTLKARLETVENTPAAPKVFTNGQTPPPGQMRGQDKGAQPVDIAKAAALKEQLSAGTATPAEQNAAYRELMEMSVAQLSDIHARR